MVESKRGACTDGFTQELIKYSSAIQKSLEKGNTVVIKRTSDGTQIKIFEQEMKRI